VSAFCASVTRCQTVLELIGACRLSKKIENAKDKIKKLLTKKDNREELKNVALGTSKINYLDPRITVAWCKRLEMPIEKIFNKSLLGKFSWAMPAEPNFAF
jgi:DNA topoisomerase I